MIVHDRLKNIAELFGQLVKILLPEPQEKRAAYIDNIAVDRGSDEAQLAQSLDYIDRRVDRETLRQNLSELAGAEENVYPFRIESKVQTFFDACSHKPLYKQI